MSDRVTRHVERFNAAVRSGDWTEFLAGFADSARVEFTGGAAGQFTGRFTGLPAITQAYRTSPPDDTLEILDVAATRWTDTVRFAWTAGGTGTLWLAWTGAEKLNVMVVDFD
jgi:hypothetical protein